MMTGIDRYIFRQILIALLFIAITLTCAVWLSQSMQFIKLILNRGMSLGTFLALTGFLLPSFMLVVLPASLFFSVLFTFNKMLNDRELVVLRNAGVSPVALAKAPLMVAAGVALIGYFISLYLMPVSLQAFRDLQFEVRNNASSALLQPGVFRSLGRDLTIYVRERDDRQLRGLLVQDDRNPEKPTTITAERGAVVSSEEGPRVMLFSGTRQEVDRETGQTSVLYFEQYSFDVNWLVRDQQRAWREPDSRFVWDLLSPDMSSVDRHFADQLVAAGHNRLTAPLYAFDCVLIAIACLLYGQFNKRGQNHRVGIAVFLTGAMYGAALGIYSLTTKDNTLIPLLYANAVLPGLVALAFLLPGAHRMRRIQPSPS